MKRILIATFVMLCISLSALGQTSQETNAEVNEGTRQYRAGNFVEAQKHFEKALQSELTHKNAQLFAARAILAQYKPGLDTPENVGKAQEAIEAYKRVLENKPDDDNAYDTVAYLYRQLKDEQGEHDWLMARANSASAPNEKRAQAFLELAVKQSACSYAITELSDNKETIYNPARIVRHRKPKEQSEFDKAKQCAARGMELIEQAISLNPENPQVWLSKANLLDESGKLAQMEGDADLKAKYAELADEARAANARIYERAAQRASATASDTSSPDGATKEVIVSQGVLDSKAISKPTPRYPEEAKAGRASGTVTVRVVVDESGNVISASAVGGHPLLQQAAADAARRAKFAPTKLSGQPVKVSGVVTYSFQLQ